MDDGVGDRLADGGFDVAQLVQGGVQLGGEGGGSRPGEGLVGGPGREDQGDLVGVFDGTHGMYASFLHSSGKSR